MLKQRWLIATGIVLIGLGALLLPLAAGLPGSDKPPAATTSRSSNRENDRVMGALDEVDLSLSLSREEEERELKQAGRRLAQLRLTLGGLIGPRQLGPPLCVAFEGWDAAGKGGAIKRLVAPLDPRHVRVAQFARRAKTSSATTSCIASGRRCRVGAG